MSYNFETSQDISSSAVLFLSISPCLCVPFLFRRLSLFHCRIRSRWILTPFLCHSCHSHLCLCPWNSLWKFLASRLAGRPSNHKCLPSLCLTELEAHQKWDMENINKLTTSHPPMQMSYMPSPLLLPFPPFCTFCASPFPLRPGRLWSLLEQ